MARIVKPNRDAIIDSQGRPTEAFFYWLQLVTDLDMLVGSGSPEGVQEARQKRLYLDTSGSAGSVLYVKQVDSISSDRTKGWVLV